MSVYHYLLCEDCKRACPAASSHRSGVAYSLAGDEWLRAFIVAHCGHTMRSTNEMSPDLEEVVMIDDHPNADERARMPGAVPVEGTGAAMRESSADGQGQRHQSPIASPKGKP